jgi:acetyltransferase-like isoleucine patch superfamily enzyme
MTLRESAKRAAFLLATIAVLPNLVSFALRARVLGRDRALQGSTQALSLAPGVLGQYLRRAFLARTLEACHPSATIEFGTIFSRCGARIDENVYVGPRCHLGLCRLERDVLLAAGVHVTSGARTHGTADPGAPIRKQEGELTRVRVGEGTWVGSAAVIMADVGARSVVGAGAVVVKPIPDLVVAAGVPAKVVRSRGEPAAPAPAPAAEAAPSPPSVAQAP